MAEPAEVRIVLLGKTGSGKSSAGNIILGNEKFKASSDPNSVSKDCQTEEGTLNGRKITVTDTPGIFDTDTKRSKEDLKNSIISWLTECAPGPHAFILVLKVAKYTEEEEESVKMILKWFGEEALKHTVVLFTHGDDLGKNQTIKEFVEKNKDLKELVDKCGGRVHVIDSKHWEETDDKNVQPADPLEQINSMMIEKREAGDLQTVQALEELKNRLSGQRPSAPDQGPGQGLGRPGRSGGNLCGSEHRSNSFQIKQLLTTIDTMVKDNGGRCYTNETLQVTAEAIEIEVNKIKEEIVKRGGKVVESEIRKQARERVREKSWTFLARVSVGAVLGALLGAVAGISIPVILASEFLKGAADRGDARRFLGAGATILQAAEFVPVQSAALGATVGLAVAGGVVGGRVGYEAAARADTVREAAGYAVEAVWEAAGEKVKDAWALGQSVAKGNEKPYQKLQ